MSKTSMQSVPRYRSLPSLSAGRKAPNANKATTLLRVATSSKSKVRVAAVKGQAVPLAESPLNGRSVRRPQTGPRLAASVRSKIEQFTFDMKEGILPKRKVENAAKKITRNGFCSPQIKKELEKIVAGSTQTLEKRKTQFQKETNKTKFLDAQAQMQHATRLTTRELNKQTKTWKAVEQSFEYCNKAKEELNDMAKLGSKLQETGSLSKKEMKHFSQVLWKHKENIPILLTHLEEQQNKLTQGSGVSAIVTAAQNNLVEIQMNLADLMTLHSDHLPEMPPLSRQQRMQYHLLQTKGTRQAVKNLKENYFSSNSLAKTRLDVIDKRLARHEKQITKLKDSKIPTSDTDMEYLLEMPIKEEVKLTKAQTIRIQEKLVAAKNLPLAMQDMPQEQMLTLYLQGALNHISVPKSGLPDVKFLQKQGKAAALNQQAWNGIDNEIQFTVDGSKHKVRSTIRPAGEHSAQLAEPYENKGVSCQDRLQYSHAVNLAATELTNDKGEKLFSAHRSGVLDSYDITPKNMAKLSDPALTDMLGKLVVEPKLRSQTARQLLRTFRSDSKEAKALTGIMRKQATQVMAKDLAATMVLNDPALLAPAQEGEVVELPILSISLMTPDYLRGLSGKVSEKQMAQNHKEGLDILANKGEPLSLTIRDKQGNPQQIRVKVTPRVLSFGVNAGAQRGFGILSGNRSSLWRRLMGWQLVAPNNNVVLDELVGASNVSVVSGAAGIKIAQLKRQQSLLLGGMRTSEGAPARHADNEIAAHQKQIDKITQLSEQVKTIWRSKSFLREARDPYKMPTRIALLADAIGQKPLFHCKSGKDRTGQLDGEAKYLASQFEVTGKFPAPSTAPSEESKRLRTKFALQTGNHEMQQYSTGIPGYKLKGVPTLDAQFQENYFANYRGGSEFVRA